jgi:predicted N-acetyltransferase YhbS
LVCLLKEVAMTATLPVQIDRSVGSTGTIRLRPIETTDVDAAARIAFDAFAGIADRHAFPRDFPDVEGARQLVGAFTEHPAIWGIVAERDGRVVGSNFLDERSPIRGVGPVTVDPHEQSAGVGRLLMRAVLDRAATGAGVRLLQDSFNTASLALYASLGFAVVGQVALVAGAPSGSSPGGLDVRPITDTDLDDCEQLCLSVHGFERTRELRDALDTPGLAPVAGHRDGRLVAYATTFADFGVAYAVAETEVDLFGLIVGAVAITDRPVSFLLPLHQHDLVWRCLAAGLRVVKPMTYMAFGPYQRPRGAWIPSVLA